MNQVIQVAMTADVGGFIKNFSQADTAVGKLGATMSGLGNLAKAGAQGIDNIGEAVKKAALKVGAASAAITAAFGKSVQSAAKLETSMNNVGSIMDDQGRKQLPQFTQAILKMSKDGYQSAVDLANGFYDISSSGFQGAAGLKVLDASQKAATAGLTTTANAAQAITAVLNAYGQNANQAGKDSDYLFQTVNVGVITFEQLTQTLGDVVGSAAQTGTSIKEVGAALATMTLNGIQSQEAGTSLNRVIQSFLKPSQAMNDELQKLGYASGQSALQTDGLYKVMGRLREAAHGNVATLAEWFQDIRGLRGALALFSNDGQNYARVMASMNDATKGQGATQRALDQQTKSLSLQWQKFVNNLQAVSIELGQRLLPLIKPIIQLITSLVGAFNDLPGPIKEVIAVGGALSSVFLTLGAAFVVWRAKSLAMGFVFKTLGQQIERVGTEGLLANSKIATFGQNLQQKNSIIGLFGARALISAAGIKTFGSSIVGSGQRVQEFGQRVGVLGLPLTLVGKGLTSAGRAGDVFRGVLGGVAKVVGNVVASLGTLTAIGIGTAMMWQSSSEAAQKYVDTIDKGFNKNNMAGYNAQIMKADQALSNFDKKMGKDSSGILNNAKSFFKQIGDLATNTFGADIIKDSPLDEIVMKKKLDANDKQIRQWAANMNQNLETLFYQINGPQAMAHMTQQDLNVLSNLADKFGIDLTGGFKQSAGARAEFIKDLNKMRSQAGLTADEIQNLQLDPSQIQAMADEINKLMQSVSDTFMKSMDVFGNLDLKKAIGPQLHQGYQDALKQGQTFINDLNNVTQRGLDPQTLLRLMQMPLEQSVPILEAMVKDSSGKLIQESNAAEQAMRDMAVKTAQYARLAQIAVNDATGQKTGELSKAFQIQDLATQMGNKANIQDIAAKLGMSPADAQKISDDFTMNISGSLAKFAPPDIASKVYGPMTAAQQKQIFLAQAAANAFAGVKQNVYDMALGMTHIQPQVMQNLVESTDKLGVNSPKVQKMVDSLQLLPSEKQIVLNLLHYEDTMKKISDVKEDLTLTPDQKITKLMTIGGPDAMAAINDIRNNNPPDKTVTLRLNDQATAGLEHAQDILDSIRAHPDAYITIHQAMVAAGGDPRAAYTGVHGTSGADGGFTRFANGGMAREYHNAQIARPGTWRLWAEPETGGEAYIPLSPAKRTNSVNTLKQVADLFGFGLMKFDMGGLVATQQRLTAYSNLAYVGGLNRGTTVANQVLAESWVEANGDMAAYFSDVQNNMRQYADKYAEVQEKLGKLTADTLAAQKLSLKDFLSVADSMIATADQTKEIQDNKFKLGLISQDQYLAVLKDRLAKVTAYTNDWMDIKNQIDEIAGQVIAPSGDIIKDRINELEQLRGKPGQVVSDIDKAINDLYQKMNAPGPNFGANLYDFYKQPFDAVQRIPASAIPNATTPAKTISLTIKNTTTVDSSANAQQVKAAVIEGNNDLVVRLKEALASV